MTARKTVTPTRENSFFCHLSKIFLKFWLIFEEKRETKCPFLLLYMYYSLNFVYQLVASSLAYGSDWVKHSFRANFFPFLKLVWSSSAARKIVKHNTVENPGWQKKNVILVFILCSLVNKNTRFYEVLAELVDHKHSSTLLWITLYISYM